MELTEGIMVTPHVQLVRPLGQGAMGEVWVADHLTLKTEVAVKFVSDQLSKDNPQVIARFEREASVAAQIKSPFVVQTFDHGVMDDGTPYIVMELLEGESLEDRIGRFGSLPLEEVAQVISQVSRALRRAHDAGIVHRDIKPDNIFISLLDDGIFCKILDFGIAKQAQLPKMGRLTNPGIMIGTPEYMSPEQVLSSKDVDAHADLWALAVTAYEALTGELPFHAEALGQLCVKLLNGTFEPPSTFRAELQGTVDEWFERALNRDIEQRFSDARTLSSTFIESLRIDVSPNLQHTGSIPQHKLPPAAPASLQQTKGTEMPAGTPEADSPQSARPNSPTLSGTFAPVLSKRSPRWRFPAVAITAAAIGALLAMMLFSDSESAPPPNAAAPTTDDAPKLAPAEPLHPTGAASANSPPHPDPAQTDGDNSAAPHGDKPPEAQPGKDETKALGNGTESNGKNAKAPPKEAKEKKPLERPESARKPANRVNRFKKRKKTPRRRDYGF